MLATVFRGVGDIDVQQVPVPAIELPTDAVVRIRAAGVCGSDLWYLRGIDPLEPGSRLGHEFVGLVEQVGPEVTGLRVGDRVVAPFSYADGSCQMCRRDLPTSCPAMGFWGGGASPGGAQAEAIRVPFADANLVRLPADGDDPTDFIRYLPLADVLPTAHHAVACGGVSPGTPVVIVGDGPVALATVLAAQRAGAGEILVLGHHPARLAVAEKLGATGTAHSPDSPADTTELVRDRLGEPAGTVIECVGSQAAVDAALAAVRDGGTLSYVGLPAAGAQIPLLETFGRNITITGGVTPARNYIPALLRDIADGVVDPSPIFDLRLPLAEARAGYAAMDERRAIKTVLCP